MIAWIVDLCLLTCDRHIHIHTNAFLFFDHFFRHDLLSVEETNRSNFIFSERIFLFRCMTSFLTYIALRQIFFHLILVSLLRFFYDPLTSELPYFSFDSAPRGHSSKKLQPQSTFQIVFYDVLNIFRKNVFLTFDLRQTHIHTYIHTNEFPFFDPFFSHITLLPVEGITLVFS